MNNKIIGIYTLWIPEWFEKFGVTLEDMKKSKIEWKTMMVNSIDEDDITSVNDVGNDFFNELLNNNETTIMDYCNNTGITRIMFKNPVPIEIITEKVMYVIPIFENDKLLNLNQLK